MLNSWLVMYGIFVMLVLTGLGIWAWIGRHIFVILLIIPIVIVLGAPFVIALLRRNRRNGGAVLPGRMETAKRSLTVSAWVELLTTGFAVGLAFIEWYWGPPLAFRPFTILFMGLSAGLSMVQYVIRLLAGHENATPYYPHLKLIAMLALLGIFWVLFKTAIRVLWIVWCELRTGAVCYQLRVVEISFIAIDVVVGLVNIWTAYLAATYATQLEAFTRIDESRRTLTDVSWYNQHQSRARAQRVGNPALQPMSQASASALDFILAASLVADSGATGTEDALACDGEEEDHRLERGHPKQKRRNSEHYEAISKACEGSSDYDSSSDEERPVVPRKRKDHSRAQKHPDWRVQAREGAKKSRGDEIAYQVAPRDPPPPPPPPQSLPLPPHAPTPLDLGRGADPKKAQWGRRARPTKF
jgi:hypothetical protein